MPHGCLSLRSSFPPQDPKSAAGPVAHGLHGRPQESLRNRDRSQNIIIRQSLLQKSNEVNAVHWKSLTAVETNNVVRQAFSISSSNDAGIDRDSRCQWRISSELSKTQEMLSRLSKKKHSSSFRMRPASSNARTSAALSRSGSLCSV